MTGDFTLGMTEIERRARALCAAAGYGEEPDPGLDVADAREKNWPQPDRAGWLRFESAARDEIEAEQMREQGWEWAIVEIFGHRRHAGRTREEERFGAKMLRVDIPNEADPDAKGWTTHYYGGSSIFSFSLSDRATVMRANKPYAPPARLSYREPDDGERDDGEPF